MLINAILRSLRARALPLLLALSLALLLARPVSAHATLLRSDPAAGAQLDQSPPSLMLEFSEELDPAFSQAQLFDSQNRLIEPGLRATTPRCGGCAQPPTGTSHRAACHLASAWRLAAPR
jgi:methionine-rich copper-binding protein CopC